MRPNSLAFRLIAGAILWSIVAVAGAGVILTRLYAQSVERSFDERIDAHLRSLIATLSLQRPPVSAEPGNMGEVRFSDPYSGWYWQVRRDGEQVMLSPSLFVDQIVVDNAATTPGRDGAFHSVVPGPNGQELRIVGREIRYEDVDGNVGPLYQFLVAGDTVSLTLEIANFRNSVLLTLAIFGLILVVATALQIRWNLRPLDRVRRGLADLRSGKEHRFEGPFPAEIEPLAKELNALLTSNQEIIDRARTQVGNLAHALKTPLSVITNEARAGSGPLAEKVAEQAERMRMQVTHYLDRARIAARSNVIGVVTPVEPVVARLARAMNRIYQDKGVSLEAEIPPGALFRGEQQDFEDILGNLADNACKWASARVTVGVGYEKPKRPEDPGTLTIVVDDDGPGLTPEQRKEATRRGKRLDESKPGSGLGLSIVTDLVALYGGTFRLDTSPAGGLRAEVTLPAV